ncbi:SymE family type I addiction module toxin [Yokenella regensburgei]|uniref:SymE family type I addiction module toxin n=1 Tax=Yokenella regensburgei TaxID=158877 RepID=UPI003F13A184
MADLHSNLDITTTGTSRELIVGYRPRGRDKSSPSLTISGKWLREVGFDTGQHYTLRAMNGCIVLTAFTDKEEKLTAELKEARQWLEGIKAAVQPETQGVTSLTAKVAPLPDLKKLIELAY